MLSEGFGTECDANDSVDWCIIIEGFKSIQEKNQYVVIRAIKRFDSVFVFCEIDMKLNTGSFLKLISGVQEATESKPLNRIH